MGLFCVLWAMFSLSSSLSLAATVHPSGLFVQGTRTNHHGQYFLFQSSSMRAETKSGCRQKEQVYLTLYRGVYGDRKSIPINFENAPLVMMRCFNGKRFLVV